jgi:hypothetical protein
MDQKHLLKNHNVKKEESDNSSDDENERRRVKNENDMGLSIEEFKKL